MRIVFISDTHNLLHTMSIPAGDILIHSGDATMNGKVTEVAKFTYDLSRLPHKHKVFVAGNHDWLFQRDPVLARQLCEEKGIVYLQDQAATIEGLKFWGSPWQPWFYDWAFNLKRGPQLAEKWALIPGDTQVLVTHGPPHGTLDTVSRPAGEMDATDFGSWDDGLLDRKHIKTHVGCYDLAARIADKLKTLKVHCFGHIHRPGVSVEHGVTYVNASSCNERYEAVHPPHVMDI